MSDDDVSVALATGPGWPADDVPGEGPLAGVRVLDCSRILAGPLATAVLADLGADVLKVERPGSGDETRRWGPPFSGDDATYFLSVNRNRRSVTLDLGDTHGAAVFETLARHADVVVENFLPAVSERLGLPGVRTATDAVWVSLRGAGSDGPAGNLPGYDAIVQARSGLMGATGFPETGPTKVGVALADVIAGLQAAVTAVAGLVARGRGARGPTVEVGLLECAVGALVNRASAVLAGAEDPGLLGNDHPSIAPYGPLRCADGELVVGAGSDAQFAALCGALARPELALDARFATNADRVGDRETLRAELTEAARTVTVGELRARLDAVGVTCAPVNGVPEALADPHITAVGLASIVHRPEGPVRVLGCPVRIDGVRPPVRRAPPTLGEHTDRVLTGLGLTDDHLAALRARGAV